MCRRCGRIGAWERRRDSRERVRRVALLAEEFSIEKGEMTPTLKVKRAVIDQKYGNLIDELYRS